MRIAPSKATTELIEQSVYLVTRRTRSRTICTSYLTSRPVTRAIVFTRTKHGADRVTRQLQQAGISAEAIHGDKSQAARQQALAGFQIRPRASVLVATDVAARGIDVDDVSHVLNYDLPQEPETYVHRIGRTGRAGNQGIALSFCDHEERSQLHAIERLIRRKLRIETGIQAAPESVEETAEQSGAQAANDSRPRLSGAKPEARPRRRANVQTAAGRTKENRSPDRAAEHRRNWRKPQRKKRSR